MNVQKYHYRYRQSGDTQIVVIPSETRYVNEMEALHQVAYDYVGYVPTRSDGRDEALTTEKFRNHLAVFPEGQFIALDKATNEVVGATVSMRLDFDPAKPTLERWIKTTDFG
jgi:hypothetical protein